MANHIQNTLCVGSPISMARAVAAIENNLVICRFCYDRIEFANVGAYETERVEQCSEACYLCEQQLDEPRPMFRVHRPAPGQSLFNPPKTKP